MLEVLVNWLLSAILILVTGYIIPGVHISDFTSALLASVVLGIINALLKPLIVILTLPINLLTLGLFTLIINGVLVMLASSLVSGFQVDSFGSALLFGIVLSILNFTVNQLYRKS